jgi:hypothetical protein
MRDLVKRLRQYGGGNRTPREAADCIEELEAAADQIGRMKLLSDENANRKTLISAIKIARRAAVTAALPPKAATGPTASPATTASARSGCSSPSDIKSTR